MLETPPRQKIYRHIVADTARSPQAISLILVAFLGLLFNPFGIPGLLWVVFGLAGIVSLIFASLTDANVINNAFNTMTNAEFEVDSIQNPRSRQRLQQALEYVSSIRQTAQKASGGARVRLESTADELSRWASHIHTLARRIDLYEEDSLLRRDLARVPYELKTIQQRLNTETDERIVADLQASQKMYETHLAHLQQLETAIKRATIQLDNTLASVGTVYAQVQLLDARQVDGGRSERLRQDIHNEIDLLKDTIESIDDVQQQSLHAATS